MRVMRNRKAKAIRKRTDMENLLRINPRSNNFVVPKRHDKCHYYQGCLTVSGHRCELQRLFRKCTADARVRCTACKVAPFVSRISVSGPLADSRACCAFAWLQGVARRHESSCGRSLGTHASSVPAYEEDILR